MPNFFVYWNLVALEIITQIYNQNLSIQFWKNYNLLFLQTTHQTNVPLETFQTFQKLKIIFTLTYLTHSPKCPFSQIVLSPICPFSKMSFRQKGRISTVIVLRKQYIIISLLFKLVYHAVNRIIIFLQSHYWYYAARSSAWNVHVWNTIFN